MRNWERCKQLTAAPAGWYAVHADRYAEKLELSGPVAGLVTLRPIAAFGLFDTDDDSDYAEAFKAIAARDHYYGSVPSGFVIEDEAQHFIGYLEPGGNLELFRGAIEDHYEAIANAPIVKASAA